MIYIGVDPGLDGAIALISDNTALLRIHDMPTLKLTMGKSKKRIVDAVALSDMLSSYAGLSCALVEKVSARPGQGVTSMFNFGFSTGIVVGILTTLGIPITRVAPQTWKAVMLDGMSKDKSASVARAVFLYPRLHDVLVVQGKGKDGRAEALLMADYLRKSERH